MGLLGNLRRYLHGLRGNTHFERYAELEKMQYMPQETLRSLQFAQLSKLIQHAYATTPYYKDLFDGLSIHPQDISSFEDYAQLPLLTKDIMQDNLERLCSTVTPKEQRILNTSGGTTGNPAKFYQDKHVFSEMEAHRILMLSMAGWTPDDMLISLWGNPSELLSNKAPSLLKPWLSGMAVLNAYRYDANSMDMWIKVIKRYKRVLLYGYTTVITDFARHCMENQVKGLPIFAAMTTAEILDSTQRAYIEKAFSCQVFDQYGSREMPGVSSQCSHGNMHIFTSANYAEFLPLEDAQDSNTQKRIILTSLNNYTMPFLRYEIGDLGAAGASSCPCGRGYPLMHMEVGRIGASLRLPEGGRLYSTMFVRQMYHIDGINAFQFRQTQLRHVNLYIIQGKNFSSESEQKIQNLANIFPQSICPGAQLQVHYVKDLPRTQGGKHRQVICEVDA